MPAYPYPLHHKAFIYNKLANVLIPPFALRIRLPSSPLPLSGTQFHSTAARNFASRGPWSETKGYRSVARAGRYGPGSPFRNPYKLIILNALLDIEG
jgi:hypothetical protein